MDIIVTMACEKYIKINKPPKSRGRRAWFNGMPSYFIGSEAKALIKQDSSSPSGCLFYLQSELINSYNLDPIQQAPMQPETCYKLFQIEIITNYFSSQQEPPRKYHTSIVGYIIFDYKLMNSRFCSALHPAVELDPDPNEFLDKQPIDNSQSRQRLTTHHRLHIRN